jgi:hypothetical protein
VLTAVCHRLEELDEIFSKIASRIRISTSLEAEEALLLVERGSTSFISWTRAYLVGRNDIEDAAILPG